MNPASRAFVADCVFVDGRFASQCVVLDEVGRILAYADEPPPGAVVERLPGRALIPGFINSHSHVFQRLIRGAAEAPVPGAASSFWTWRSAMYALVSRLDPDVFELIAKATFREMRAAGYTRVKEFHYVHHAPGGTPYDDPHEMAWRLVAAAEDAGIDLEIERTMYLETSEPAQARFRDASADRAVELTDDLRQRAPCPVGIAPHSVRAVGREAWLAAAAWSRTTGAELHAHVAEQPKEVAQCIDQHGARPLAWLADLGVLSDRFVGVHLTHLDPHEVAAVGAAGATACLCPSTESNLGDGVPDLEGLLSGGARLAIGSDSQAHIDPFLELRMLEYNERLRRGVRHVFDPAALLAAVLEPAPVGAAPTFVTLDLNAPSIAAAPSEHLAEALVMAAGIDAVVGSIRHGRLETITRRPDWLRQARARLAP